MSGALQRKQGVGRVVRFLQVLPPPNPRLRTQSELTSYAGIECFSQPAMTLPSCLLLFLAAQARVVLSASDDEVPDINRLPPSPLYGVPPELQGLYTPDETRTEFACLDGSKTIPFSEVNDNYCHCSDGSDEPGTAACNQGVFYCANSGHFPVRIKSTRVNDGVCEPECCDGSDEYNGLTRCPNRCAEARQEYLVQQKALEELRIKESEAKQKMIAEGQRLREEQTNKLQTLNQNLEEQELEIQRLQSLEKEMREKSQMSEFDLRLHKNPGATLADEVENVVLELMSRVTELTNRVRETVDILAVMKQDHNPNYHDMAVKHAIEKLDQFLTLHKEFRPATMESEADVLEVPPSTTSGDLQEQISGLLHLATKVRKVESERPEISEEITKAHPSKAPSVPPVAKKMLRSWKIGRYRVNLAALQPYLDPLYQWVLSYVVPPETEPMTNTETKSPMPEVGTLDKSDDYSDKVAEAQAAKKAMEQERENLQAELASDYGKDHEYAPLAKQCYEIDGGSFRYKLCLFDSVTQRDRNSYSPVTIGQFTKWGVEYTDPNDPRYYTEQLYGNGEACWHGPKRTAQVFFECGLETKLVQVAEPAKCEYHLRMVTPAACEIRLPNTAANDQQSDPLKIVMPHDEL
ncbi:hypothetical protein IWQ62_000428, partial [Dispira parvispora]